MDKTHADEPQRHADAALSDSPFLTPGEAAGVLKLAKGTLANMRLNGTGPRFRKHGRLVRYDIDDLKAWSASRMRTSTSQDDLLASDDADPASND